MTKTYLPTNVYDAAFERLNFVFDRLDRVCVSFSGGKDSTVGLDMAYRVAQSRGRSLDVLFVDWEAQYQATIEHMSRTVVDKPGMNVWWVCLPISTSNESSVYDPIFTAWDPAKQEVWVRPLPPHDCVITTENNPFPFYTWGMTFEDFIGFFSTWYAEQGGMSANIVSIRADESINRWRTIKRKTGRKRYENIPWSTRLTDTSYNFYPFYDWRVEDVWAYVAQTGISYNHVYDKMWLAGMSLHEMRICEPYSLEARSNLDKYHAIEPETWARMTQRTEGVNFGARHGKSELFAFMRNKSKPESMTWKEYSLAILQTMPEPLRAHYWRRIRVFIEWFENHLGWEDLEEESDPKRESKKLGGSWRMVAHTLLKNDFFCAGLSFSINNDEFAKYYELVARWEAGEAIDLPPTPEEADGKPITHFLGDNPKLSARRKPLTTNTAAIKEKYKDL